MIGDIMDIKKMFEILNKYYITEIKINDKKPIKKVNSVMGSNIHLDIIYNMHNEYSFKIKNIQALNFNKNFGFEIFKEDEDFFYLKLSKEIWENSKKSRLLKPIKRYLDKIEHYFE